MDIEDIPLSYHWVKKTKLRTKVKSIVLICLNNGKNIGGFLKYFLTASMNNDKPSNK